MNITINLTGANSNELYTISAPNNILNFCNYDFNPFMDVCIGLCKKYMKSGEINLDEMVSARNSIAGCHKFFENNIRGIFDKIVIDCWIEYICRTNEIGTASLWNSFISCSTPFEKAVFARLSEYRSKRAINEWVNLLKIQEYAEKKLDYVFGTRLESASEAACRANTFDLMFSIAANEQGYSLGNIGSVKSYKVGRLPNSPFVMASAAKELLRNVLGDVSYSDESPATSRTEGTLSDQEAMDAFALIKNHIPGFTDNVANTIVKSLSSVPKTVYVPSCFKACVDLEIDQIIESGVYLQRCQRCKQFYLREPDYDFDFCDRISAGGRTCLEIMGKSAPEKRTALASDEIALLKTKSDVIYKEMNDRVGIDFTQRDMSEWFSTMTGIKNHVLNGEATLEDFDSFIEYSRSMSFAKKPVEAKSDGKPEVKPYQFQRVDRRELERQGLISKPSDDDGDYRLVPFVQAASVAATQTTVVQTASPSVPPVPVVTRVIRGADANVTFYEQDLSAEKRAENQAEEKQSLITKEFPEKQQKTSPGDFDIKIYSGKHPEPPKPVYEPKPVQNSVFEVHEVDENLVSGAEPKQEAAPKNAQVVNAYKTVTSLPKIDASLEEEAAKAAEEPEKPAIDFSEILNGIERSDGFEDENIPVDADGVPLSHKTKHVLDAIMKPSRINPSLRRPPDRK